MKYPTRKTILVLMKPNTRELNGGWKCPFCGHNEQKYPTAYSHVLCCAHDRLGDAVPSIVSSVMKEGEYCD